MNDLIVSNADIKEMAKAMGPLFNKRPEDMFALMLIAQAEGKHPAMAAQEYDIIQGKPAINSRSAQARFQLSGGKIEWVTRTDAEVTATFSHPQGGSLTITWNMARAAQAGLATKDMWKKYPAQMMSARVIAEGVRAVFPACLSGLYLPEEIQDFDNPRKSDEPRNVTPAQSGQPNPDKPLMTGIQDAETNPPTEEETKAAEAREATELATREAVKKITDIGRGIAAIVKTESGGGWTDAEKKSLDIKELVKESRATLDANLCLVALRRVEIADQYRGVAADWPVVVADLIKIGLDLEALDQRKAGLTA
jgi:hypothetical protein